jgi:fructose-bisphosphate aldolase class II
MALVSTKQILDKAMKHNYGVGAYNVNNMEQIQAIMLAAKTTQSPVIIQASKGALKYSSFIYLSYLMKAAIIDNPDIPVAMHLDHGNSLQAIIEAINLGFSSVMIDGSLLEDGKTPSTYDYNVKVTKSVVEYAHKHGISVEAEIGTLGGIEDGIGSKNGKSNLTNPKEAKNFVEETGVDSLAISIGTSHGAYKFKGEAKLAFNILQEVRSLIKIPIVLHGASSVPKYLVDEVNKYGGRLPGAAGVPITSIQKAIQLGISKINVDTDGRLVMTAAIRKFLLEHPEKFDPRDYLSVARTELTKLISSKMKDFYTAGHIK